MQNVVLVIHLILSVSLIGIVLLQRSEGGGLGIGGGGNNGGGGRPKAAPLAKVTWIIAIAFLITSITLTIIAAKNSGGYASTVNSVTDSPSAIIEIILIVDIKIESTINVSMYFKSFEPKYIKQI